MDLVQQNKTVPSIDFLPTSYRDDYARRKARHWQIVVVAAFLLTLPVASLFQYRARRSVELEIDDLTTMNSRSRATAADLAEVQAELNDSEAMARLVTYLGHPWPQTQILAALVNESPQSVSLTELDIARGETGGAQPARPIEEHNPQASETIDPDQPAAARDLETLRAASSGRVLVHLAGTSFDLGQLHQYLGALAKHELFDDVHLESVETMAVGSTQSDAAHFRAVLIVRPAYGEPGSPVGEPARTAAATTTRTATPAGATTEAPQHSEENR